MDSISFTLTGWQQYTEWAMTDKRIVKRINELIKDIQRNGLMTGIGKPEALKHRKAYSRRINDEHRLVYTGDGDTLTIIACRGHYSET